MVYMHLQLTNGWKNVKGDEENELESETKQNL